MNNQLREKIHQADFCVVGGGMAGMLAAVAAARRGASVVLMHDRPVLGGNASSEVRMWIRGASGADDKESGILEELDLENMYRNPYSNYSIWDSVLYGKVRQEQNITLLLNCSCNDAVMEGNRIQSIRGWQTTTQTWHTVQAKGYADCSGDSILAPLTGAIVREGREGTQEFGESIAPPVADDKTMGASCLMQARQYPEKRTFIPPSWARKITKEQLPHRMPELKNEWENYWYMELGGEQDTLHDSEELRDSLLSLAFGIWDYIKNSGECDADNWELDWLGYLPGKRETRRYVGDYIMTQHDVESGGHFDDVVAYGGWSMDDHHPKGFETPEKPTTYHPAPSPYGIPYRCLYSKNVENLWCAGRNVSVTHSAFSSIRVMGTCAVMGQAVGTAAAIAAAQGIAPRQVDVTLLQQHLLEDDCYLPGQIRRLSAAMAGATLASEGRNVETIRNGVTRELGEQSNKWVGKAGDSITCTFAKPIKMKKMVFVFDSDLRRQTLDDGVCRRFSMKCNIPLGMKPLFVPKTLVKAFRVFGVDKAGKETLLAQVTENYMRNVTLKAEAEVCALRFMADETWGGDAGLFLWDVE